MKKMKKIIVSLIILIIFLMCISKIGNKDTGKIETVNNQIENQETTKIEVTQTLKGLEFSNIEIQKKTDMEYVLTADVLNKNNNIIEAQIVRIIVKNDNGLNEIFAGNISSIKAKETGLLRALIRNYITSATSVTFEIIE